MDMQGIGASTPITIPVQDKRQDDCPPAISPASGSLELQISALHAGGSRGDRPPRNAAPPGGASQPVTREQFQAHMEEFRQETTQRFREVIQDATKRFAARFDDTESRLQATDASLQRTETSLGSIERSLEASSNSLDRIHHAIKAADFPKSAREFASATERSRERIAETQKRTDRLRQLGQRLLEDIDKL